MQAMTEEALLGKPAVAPTVTVLTPKSQLDRALASGNCREQIAREKNRARRAKPRWQTSRRGFFLRYAGRRLCFQGAGRIIATVFLVVFERTLEADTELREEGFNHVVSNQE